MAFTRFETDVSNISKLSNRPNQNDGLSAAQLKQRFDKAGDDIKEFVNDTLIAELESTADGASGADNIGVTPIAGLEGNSSQSIMESLKDYATNVAGDATEALQRLEEAESDIDDLETNKANAADVYTKSAADAEFVDKTSTETVTGKKTFTQAPEMQAGINLGDRSEIVPLSGGMVQLNAKNSLGERTLLRLAPKDINTPEDIISVGNGAYWYKLWHQGNMGAGRGLDADKLDGKHDSDMLHKAGAETVTGVKTFIASPEVPEPATDTQAATKKYADDIANARYTKTNMQTEGEALVHWGNLINVPNFGDLHWKTPVANKASLPLTDNEVGDNRVVLDDGDGKQAVYTCVAITGDVNAQWSKIGDVDWVSEEATRQTQEIARQTAEGSADPKSGRVGAELDRVSAELARATAEGDANSGRVKAELDREEAEGIREANELLRQAHINDTENPHEVTAEQAGAVPTTSIANTLTETEEGKVLDARQGKALKDLVDTRIAHELGEEHIIKTLPNGVKDEIILNNGQVEVINRVGGEEITSQDFNSYFNMASRVTAPADAAVFANPKENMTRLYVNGVEWKEIAGNTDATNPSNWGKYGTRAGQLVQLYLGDTVDSAQQLQDWLDNNEVMFVYQRESEQIVPMPPVMTPNTEAITSLQALTIRQSQEIEELEREVYFLLPSPYPARLGEPEIIQTGTFHYPKWMTEEGDIIYGNYGKRLLMSADEWDTTQIIVELPTPDNIAGMRLLDDGEVIFTTSQDEGTGRKSKVFKTIGHEGINIDCDTVQVLEAKNATTLFNNQWGIDVYKNIVLVSDYGGWGEFGARNAYLSTDYGETFTEIFDLMTEEVDGRPPATSTAHIHAIKYDQYYERIWLTVGDSPNTATYYSDDMGETWIFVDGSDYCQFTGIQIFEDGVVFGSDSAPNGVWTYKRKSKEIMPVIEPLLLLNDETVITYVGQFPFKRSHKKNTPCYFTFSCNRLDLGYFHTVIGLVNASKAYVIREYEGGVPYVALGDTQQGNIVLSRGDPDLGGYIVAKVKAPEWI